MNPRGRTRTGLSKTCSLVLSTVKHFSRIQNCIESSHTRLNPCERGRTHGRPALKYLAYLVPCYVSSLVDPLFFDLAQSILSPTMPSQNEMVSHYNGTFSSSDHSFFAYWRLSVQSVPSCHVPSLVMSCHVMSYHVMSCY